MKYLKLTIYALIFLASLASFNCAKAATDFTSVVDPGNGTGTDYTSLSSWESGVQTDLTAATTLVFAGTKTGTIADNASVTGATSGATATVVHATGTQILLESISGGPFQNGEQIRVDVSNYFTTSNTGDSAIAVAKCRTSTGVADIAVTIDGFTTSATNYIKIWTDTSENYRHQGKWDDNKYRMGPAGSNVLTLSDQNILIDGIQFNSNNGYGTISTSSLPDSTEIKISNCIFLGNSTASRYGIYLGSTGTTSIGKIWNNIVYDFTGTASAALRWDDSDWTIYAYNNTIHNCSRGIERGNDTAHYTKNNLISSTDAFYGTFTDNDTNNNYNAISENNASEVAIGTNGKYNQTFAFEDENNDDFHLDSSDTAARNSGVILYDSGDDSNLYYTTDVDGNARRDSAGTWDIGADENIAKIYRSIGPSATTAITTGTSENHSNNLSISGTTATFEYPLPDNVGVGDAIQYDDDNDGDIDGSDSVVFIDKRFSSVSYRVKTATGGAPVATSSPDIDWSIYRAYTGLDIAESGTENTGIDADLVAFDAGNRDITTNQEQWNFACYANGTTADTSVDNNVIHDWVTSADSYFRVYTPTRTDEVGTSQRHNGKWDDNKYHIQPAPGYNFAVIGIREEFVRIEGLQVQVVEHQGSDWDSLIYTDSGTTFTGADIRISDNILKSITSNTVDYSCGIIATNAAGSTGSVRIWNNIIYDVKNTGNNGIGIWNDPVDGFTVYAYNNTVQNSDNGFGRNDSGTIILKNNIAQDCTDGYVSVSGSFDSASDYNLSDITGDAPGGNSRNNVSATFLDESGDDFHLDPSDANAENYGTDLSNDPYLPFNTDIGSTSCKSISNVGNTGPETCYSRPRGTTWDIGADELITPIYRSVAPEADGALDALATGASNHLNISGSTATFDTALPDNVGVGDVLEYDDDNDGDIDASDSIAFITGRTSSTVYTIKTSTGGVPTAPSAADEIHWNINRAYTSLSNAEAGTENTNIDSDLRAFDAGNRDIKANSEQWNFACYANGTTADTTAVAISSWTTSATNYIKIYTPYLTTEVGTSQRHNGKWDANKYNLSISNATAITDQDEYVRLEGMQVESSGADTNSIAVFATSSLSAENDLRISGSILRGHTNASYSYSVIMTGDGDEKIKIWNNIIQHRGSNSTSNNIGITANGVSAYVYSNTIYSGYVGFRSSNGTNYVKNILATGTGGADFLLSGGSLFCNYCASEDATADDFGGTGNRVSQNFTFSDSTNGDFHLASSDAGAKDFGADLSQDPAYQLINTNWTDIDGAGRPLSGSGMSWDIGADEISTAIYRSVAPGATSALANGAANHLNISGSTATFDTAPGDTIGVGDALEYDANNDGTVDSVAFIHGRTSSTVYTVKSYSGRAPTAQTAADEVHWNIFRASVSLSNAETGTENSGLTDAVEHFDIGWSGSGGKNLLTYNEQWNIACYANSTTADTSAVTIQDWTAGALNYLKVYTPTATTEVGTTQRHMGKWDATKYASGPPASDPYAAQINVNDDYVRIDGLQVQPYNSENRRGIIANGDYIYITSNIVKGGNANQIGIKVDTGAIHASYISNNIIYDFTATGALGYTDGSPSGANIYFYSNTVNNCTTGADSTLRTTLKNNIVQNCTDGYSATFNSDSDYNISDISASEAPNATFTNDYVNVSFADEANDDFHLASTDTSAKDVGTSLASDTYLPFSTDVDLNNRGNSTWDIGADEAPVLIYRSVGPSEDEVLETGAANHLNISGSTATFDSALGDDVGVGDALEYDDDNDGDIDSSDSIAFIFGRTSSTVYTIKTSTGGTPTAPSAADEIHWNINRAYTSGYNAMSGTENTLIDSDLRNFDTGNRDIWTNNEQWNIACYAHGTTGDTSTVSLQSWTVYPTNYVRLYTPYLPTEVGTSQRHNGKWDGNKFYINADDSNAVGVRDPYARIEGLQLYLNNATSYRYGISPLISQPNAEIFISNNIIKSNNTTTIHRGIVLDNGMIGANSNFKIFNNIFYDFEKTNNNTDMIWVNDDDATAYIYNNTFYGGYNGIVRDRGTAVAKNNIVQDAIDGFSGTFTSSDYNLSNISSDAPSASYRNGDATTVTFQDATNKDFHLASSEAYARNNGTSLAADASLPFATDIDRNGRGDWDIGADEGSVEMEATVQASSGDYSTLSGWESGMQTDLVTNTTMAFSGTKTGTIADNASVTGATSGATATVVHSTSTQILLESISGTFQSSEQIRVDVSNYFTTSDEGNPASAVAKIDGAWSSADTTAVTISGWETGPENYIKIYTAATARHQGKWDSTKYRLTNTITHPVTISENHVRIDGLQISQDDPDSGFRYGIGGTNITELSGDIRISNNIIKRGAYYDAYNAGIYTPATNPNVIFKIWNNIVYDFYFVSATADGVGIVAYAGTFYVYNNTVVNCNVGYRKGTTNANFKNNIYQRGSATGRRDSFTMNSGSWTGSDYNLGDTTSGAPGANSKQNTKVKFMDENGDDFRLAPEDTGAKNSGTDLSADANLAFATDIKSVTRSGTWDMGADETSEAVIYRSVGPGEDEVLETGAANHLNISGSTATFDTGLGNDVGVGDALEYDDDNDGDIDANDSIAFIFGRTSSTVYTIKTSTGGTPTAPSAADEIHWNINRAYTSLANWEVGTENTLIDSDLRAFDAGNRDIATNNEQWNVACYSHGTTADQTAVAINGWTTSAENYIRIFTPTLLSEAGTNQRHQGKWDENKYRLEIANDYAMGAGGNFVKVDGIQISVSTTGSSTIVGIQVGNSSISNNIIKCASSGSSTGFFGIVNSGLTAYIWNNIIYDFNREESGVGIYSNDPASVIYAYNNTFVNNYSAAYNNNGGVFIAKNNIYSNSGTYLISDSNSTNSAIFINEANDDFHLSNSDTAARNAGTDLSSDSNLSFSDDIDGELRNIGGAWDIGADEGGTTTRMKGGVHIDGGIKIQKN